MTSKLQIRTEAAGVGIAALWDALTKDKIEVIRKAAPGLLTKSEFLEGEGITLGALLKQTFGPDFPHLAPMLERIVEFDEKEHLLSFQVVEGGYLNRGLAYCVLSFKLDEVGEGNALLTTTVTYDLEKEFGGGAKLLEEIHKDTLHYVDSVVSYLKKELV